MTDAQMVIILDRLPIVIGAVAAVFLSWKSALLSHAAKVAAQKTDTLIAKTDIIHTQTNSNLCNVQMELKEVRAQVETLRGQLLMAYAAMPPETAIRKIEKAESER